MNMVVKDEKKSAVKTSKVSKTKTAKKKAVRKSPSKTKAIKASEATVPDDEKMKAKLDTVTGFYTAGAAEKRIEPHFSLPSPMKFSMPTLYVPPLPPLDTRIFMERTARIGGLAFVILGGFFTFLYADVLNPSSTVYQQSVAQTIQYNTTPANEDASRGTEPLSLHEMLEPYRQEIDSILNEYANAVRAEDEVAVADLEVRFFDIETAVMYQLFVEGGLEERRPEVEGFFKGSLEEIRNNLDSAEGTSPAYEPPIVTGMVRPDMLAAVGFLEYSMPLPLSNFIMALAVVSIGLVLILLGFHLRTMRRREIPEHTAALDT